MNTKQKNLTRRDLDREARRHGGHVESDSFGSNVRLQCIAPKGKRWAGEGLHALVCTWDKGDPVWRDDSIADAIDRMSGGLEPCDPATCECGCWGGPDMIGIHGN